MRSGKYPALKAERIARWTRYAVYAVMIAMLIWVFDRFSFVRLEPGDSSILGVSGIHRILVERYGDDASTIEKGQVVVFAMLDPQNRQIFRISRVAGRPGDRVETREGRYFVNGEDTGVPAREGAAIVGEIPPGYYLLFNDSALSASPDSRRLGFVDRRAMVGRFLSEMPF